MAFLLLIVFERAFDSPWFCFYGLFTCDCGGSVLDSGAWAFPRRFAPAGPLVCFLFAAPQAAHGHGAPTQSGHRRPTPLRSVSLHHRGAYTGLLGTAGLAFASASGQPPELPRGPHQAYSSNQGRLCSRSPPLLVLPRWNQPDKKSMTPPLFFILPAWCLNLTTSHSAFAFLLHMHMLRRSSPPLSPAPPLTTQGRESQLIGFAATFHTGLVGIQFRSYSNSGNHKRMAQRPILRAEVRCPPSVGAT